MARKRDITIEELRKLVVYDEQTGVITYLPRGPENFTATPKRTPEWLSRWWNARFANQNAGCIHHTGYVHVRVGIKNKISGHVIAWALYYNEWPKLEIDHINTIRHDNRISNLRLATREQQMCNRTGWGSRYPKGVSRTRTGKFHARIQYNGNRVLLGIYETAEEAFEAYLRASNDLHKEYART